MKKLFLLFTTLIATSSIAGTTYQSIGNTVFGSDGTTYDFQEMENGRYLSVLTFGTQQNTSYQLEITTTNGKSYISEMVLTPDKATIDDVYVEQEVNDSEEDGVAIFVDTGG